MHNDVIQLLKALLPFEVQRYSKGSRTFNSCMKLAAIVCLGKKRKKKRKTVGSNH